MKNIFKLLIIFIAAGTIFVSCEKIPYFEDHSQPADPNSTGYYLQFVNAAKKFETGVTEAGGLVEVQSSIAVVLMGMPQSQDLTVNLTLDPSSTFESDMYTLSSTSITIPAGQTSGSVDFSTVAANMPVGEELMFILNMDAGEHNNPNPDALKVTYKIKRIEFCPLVNGAADLVGAWTGTDGTYWDSKVTTTLSGSDLSVSGLSFGMIEGWWGEPIVAGGTFTMKVIGNGKFEIPRQYIYTTTYNASEFRYEVEGTGKWTNCGEKPTMELTYDIYYEGDADGLAKTYPSYLDGTGVFKLIVSL